MKTRIFAALILNVLLAFGLFGCAGAGQNEPAPDDGTVDESASSQSVEDAINAYSEGNEDAAKDILATLGVSEEDYECYKAIGIAQAILDGSADNDSESLMHDFEYSLRLSSISDQSNKQILVDYFDVLASAANLACEQGSTYFESIYGNLSKLAKEYGQESALQDAVPNGEKGLEEIAADREAERAERAEKAVSKDNIEEKLLEQEVYCSAPEIRVRDANYKALYPDYIYIESVQNNTDKVIRDVSITVAAWDENGYPVRIYNLIASDEGNMTGCALNDVNLEPGAAWVNSGGGWDISEESSRNVAQLKALVSECTFVDGTTWENPLAQYWMQQYYNKAI